MSQRSEKQLNNIKEASIKGQNETGTSGKNIRKNGEENSSQKQGIFAMFQRFFKRRPPNDAEKPKSKPIDSWSIVKRELPEIKQWKKSVKQQQKVARTLVFDENRDKVHQSQAKNNKKTFNENNCKSAEVIVYEEDEKPTDVDKIHYFKIPPKNKVPKPARRSERLMRIKKDASREFRKQAPLNNTASIVQREQVDGWKEFLKRQQAEMKIFSDQIGKSLKGERGKLFKVPLKNSLKKNGPNLLKEFTPESIDYFELPWAKKPLLDEGGNPILTPLKKCKTTKLLIPIRPIPKSQSQVQIEDSWPIVVRELPEVKKWKKCVKAEENRTKRKPQTQSKIKAAYATRKGKSLNLSPPSPVKLLQLSDKIVEYNDTQTSIYTRYRGFNKNWTQRTQEPLAAHSSSQQIPKVANTVLSPLKTSNVDRTIKIKQPIGAMSKNVIRTSLKDTIGNKENNQMEASFHISISVNVSHVTKQKKKRSLDENGQGPAKRIRLDSPSKVGPGF